ncbi:MAG: hypothetical protein AUH11_01485 [Acidobacteria bacterium 13_2_20CM_57_17]|nr:MAG: hypothetical protein AUH11_01485 [Acidobacteria bacterium 13_2_20CM_57_17]OLB97997.1 MAG: hypothetical protein AUI02_00205 [Acidobacteria bacterium 13_2_20CM_2_57_12]
MTRALRFACCSLLFALASSSALAQNGVITTVAGGGTGPNNIPAIDAGIGYVYPVATDPAGNFYFATNSPNYAVFKVDTSGTLTRFGGTGLSGFSGDGGPATAAQISCVYGLALDLHGNLYLADTCNNRVRKVDASTGIITTVAGNGSYGSSPEGSPATSASLASPYSIAVDAGGNLFIADFGNYRIRRVDAGSGTITAIAGNGSFGLGTDGVAATSTNLGYVYGLTLDGAGNLYFTDLYSFYNYSYGYYTYYHRVRRIDARTQNVTTVAGGLGDSNYCSLPLGDGGAATSAGLCEPRALATDSTGNIYISDVSHYRIRKVDSSGTITTFAGNGTYGFSGDGGPAANASFSQPWGIAVDGTGNVYIADINNLRVRRVDASTGSISTVAGNGTFSSTASGIPATGAQLYYPYSSVMDSGGSLFIADEANYLIRRVDATSGLISNYAGTGNYGYSADGTVATAANVGCSVAVALDSAQNVYLADACNNVVRKIDRTSGLIFTVAGVAFNSGYNGDGIAATSSYLSCPYGIAFDNSNNLYIADLCNYRTRKVDHVTGLISTVAGNGTYGFSGDGGVATRANLSYPYGITVDRSNNLFIADEGNQRVRRVDATTGVITTIAGGGSDYSSNGIPATGAGLSCAVGLASDSAGDVFISDECTSAIRKVDSSGNINTVAGTVSSYGFSGDGGPATSAMLANPWGISVSAAGDLYISDLSNQRIRKVTGVSAPSNQPPIANAGPNQTYEATSAAGANVPLDGSGSSDPNGDALTYTWSGPFGTATGIKPTVVMPLGINMVALVVDDGHGNTAQATVQITVMDTTLPVLTVPGSITVHASSASGAVVTFTASANDTVSGTLPAACTPPSGSTFSIGTTTVNCTAVDQSGNASSGSFTVTVSTLSQSITFAALADKKYGDAAFNVSASASSGLPVSFTAMGNCSVVGSTVSLDAVGNCTVTGRQSGDATYSAATDVPQSFAIGQATSSTVVTCPATPQTYTGATQTPCTATYTTSDAMSGALTVSYSNNTNAGTAGASANYAGDTNHTGSSSSGSFTISQASSTTTVACSAGPFAYNGSPQTPCTATVTGAGGLSQSLTPTYTSNTSAGTATANASFTGDANHIGSTDSKTFTIGQASSTTTVTCPASVIYNGSAQTPCTAVATGAGSLNQSLTVNYANNLNAGTATANASFTGDANHTGSTDTKNLTINQAPSNTAVSGGGTFVYNGLAHPATVLVTGAGGLSLTPAPVYSGACSGAPVNVQETPCTASYTYAGDTNHTGSSGSTTINVTKASQTITWNVPVSMSFGAPLGGAQLNATVTGVSGGSPAGALTYTPGTNTVLGAGTQTLSVTAAATANYNSAPKTVQINVLYVSGGICNGDAGHQILQPINSDGSSVWKQGSTVPAKFRVCDVNGVSIGTAGVIKNFFLYRINSGTIMAVDETATNSTNDLAWRFDSTAQQWIFNMSTKTSPQNVANQTYYYRIDLNDGTSIYFQFGLK